MATKVQIENCLRGQSSTRDISHESNGGSWPSCYTDSSLPKGRFHYSYFARTIADSHPGYGKDVVKQTMLEHEAIFKDQGNADLRLGVNIIRSSIVSTHYAPRFVIHFRGKHYHAYNLHSFEHALYRSTMPRADEIMHKLAANTQLEEKLSDSSSSNISGATKTARVKRLTVQRLYSIRKEFDPAFWRELACAALEECQNTQGFKLEPTRVKAVPFYLPLICCLHMNFNAKDTTGTTKKMFAEVLRYKDGACKVNFCDIVDPVYCDVIKGCHVCSKKMLHPKGVKLQYELMFKGRY